jgi:hypothetical protein
MDTENMMSTKDMAAKLDYTKWHILNVAEANHIAPSQIIRTGHGNPNYLWTKEKMEQIKEHLGGHKGRPVGSKNKK